MVGYLPLFFHFDHFEKSKSWNIKKNLLELLGIQLR